MKNRLASYLDFLMEGREKFAALGLSGGGAPIENFQLHRSVAVELIDLWRKREVKTDFRQRRFATIPPDCFEDFSALTNPELRVLILFTHALRCALMRQVWANKLTAGFRCPNGSSLCISRTRSRESSNKSISASSRSNGWRCSRCNVRRAISFIRERKASRFSDQSSDPPPSYDRRV